MNRYAWVVDQLVATIVESDAPPQDLLAGAWVLCTTGVTLGDRYDGAFSKPVPPAPERHITQLAFLSRFTDAEAVAIDLASIGTTPQAAGMRRYLSKVNAAKFIDLDRADTRAGVQALEAATLLAAGRALQILDAPIQASERP